MYNKALELVHGVAKPHDGDIVIRTRGVELADERIDPRALRLVEAVRRIETSGLLTLKAFDQGPDLRSRSCTLSATQMN